MRSMTAAPRPGVLEGFARGVFEPELDGILLSVRIRSEEEHAERAVDRDASGNEKKRSVALHSGSRHVALFRRTMMILPSLK